VIDLVYAPGGTSWVRAARRAGHPAFDGTEMLLRQAAAAFSLWTGLPAPLEVMRDALISAR
jgi:shikimate dehydrogenase